MEDRYSDRWPQQSRALRDRVDHQCCMCRQAATEVHHAYYGVGFWGLSLPIAGFEIPGWQLFPLCRECHLKAHRGQWLAFKNHWNNRNRYKYLWRLRLAFWSGRPATAWFCLGLALGLLGHLPVALTLVIAVALCYYGPKLT